MEEQEVLSRPAPNWRADGQSNRPTHFPRLALQVLHSKMRQPQQNAPHTKLFLLSTTLHQYVIVDVKINLTT
jgi:hypothetical protein